MEKIMWPCSGVGVVRMRSLVVTGLGLDGYDLHSSPGMWYQDKVRPRLIHKTLKRGRRNLIFALHSKWLFYVAYITINFYDTIQSVSRYINRLRISRSVCLSNLCRRSCNGGLARCLSKMYTAHWNVFGRLCLSRKYLKLHLPIAHSISFE